MQPLPSILAALVLIVAGGCHDGGRAGGDPQPVRARPATAVADDAGAGGCSRLPFADDVVLPEASGAVYRPGAAGQPGTVLVVSDSGNGGQYVELDATDGRVVQRGRLPLDDVASDDLEGLAWRGDQLYGLTSSGYLRQWSRSKTGFTALGKAYPIATPGAGSPPLTCKHGTKVNCGANFEGLCLRETAPPGGCVGWAAAKTNGTLYCLVANPDGALAADRARAVKVGRGGVVSGCTILSGGDILVGTNLFGGNAIYRVSGAESPHPAIRLIDRAGPGFSEAIAATPDGTVFRFSDTGGVPSLMARYHCSL